MVWNFKEGPFQLKTAAVRRRDNNWGKSARYIFFKKKKCEAAFANYLDPGRESKSNHADARMPNAREATHDDAWAAGNRTAATVCGWIAVSNELLSLL
jgi:hypothetical protein